MSGRSPVPPDREGATPRLHAWEQGSGPAATVLLHGFGGWHGMWRGLAAAIPGHVLAYDLPGHAGSLGFPGDTARLAAAAILADLADRGVTAARVAGHSMGGAVALLMALADPGRIASLVLLAPGGCGEEIAAPLLARYAAAASPAELKQCLARLMAPASRVSEETVEGLARMRAVPGQSTRLAAILRAITRDGRQGVIPAASLGSIAMPVSVVWGTLDPVLPYGQTRNLPVAFALRPVPGVGHMLVEEAPAEVLEVLAGP